MVGKTKTNGPDAGRDARPRACRALPVAVALLLLAGPAGLRAQQVVKPTIPPGEGTAGPAVASPAPALPSARYSIEPGDLLDVYVVGVPELSRTYRVSPSGLVTLPMLDRPIQAQGLTPDELSDAIGAALRLQGLVSQPDVLVTVESSPRNSVAVTGEVMKPGVYPVYGETTVVDLLSQAGGLAPDAGSVAIVVRGANPLPPPGAGNAAAASDPPHASARILQVAVRHLLDTGDARQDVAIYPGDSIDVPRAGIVYVVGAVNRAGGFAMTGEESHLTVLQAVALAGNVTRTAAAKDAVIIRTDPRQQARHQQIKVNLKKVLAGKAPDRNLLAGDILFVPESTGKMVFSRAIEAATTLAIYRVPF